MFVDGEVESETVKVDFVPYVPSTIASSRELHWQSHCPAARLPARRNCRDSCEQSTAGKSPSLLSSGGRILYDRVIGPAYDGLSLLTVGFTRIYTLLMLLRRAQRSMVRLFSDAAHPAQFGSVGPRMKRSLLCAHPG